MDVENTDKILKRIKFYLVFFCLTLSVACVWNDTVTIEQVDYENEKAVGVTFSTKMDVEDVRVFVGEESQTSVIGVIVSSKDKHQFSPVVPFTPGQTYTFRKNNTEVLATFTIPGRGRTAIAALSAIHPKVDTVPENLLKMYFEFAQPMQEVGHSLDFIRVTDDTDGTVIQPFLRLENELWNEERTLLTLWLDPGRIKTDLIPNREKGLPLTDGKSYTIVVDSTWKSREGVPLKEEYTQKIYVGPRDDKRPNMRHWQMRRPTKDSLQSIYLDFKEPMDAFLASETITFYELDDTPIKGRLELLENESVLRFIPDCEWQSPEIKMRVESRLEDLAGNNLNRLFDTKVEGHAEQQPDTSRVKTLRFKLEELSEFP